MSLSSVALSRQKGRAMVSKLFYGINLNGKRLKQASDNASLAMHGKERCFELQSSLYICVFLSTILTIHGFQLKKMNAINKF